jgi:hypothetical protein
LTGTITDAASAVVPGATVVATNTATAVEVTTTTTNSGGYTLPYLPAGSYKVRVSANGFRTATVENVLLRVAQTQNVDIKLEIGTLTEQVTVTSQGEVLDAGSAEVGRYITTEEYKSWPIVVGDGQRQIQQFIFDSLPGSTGDTFKGSINGGQQYSHEILIEGMPIGRADLSGGNNNEFSPSAEAVGRVQAADRCDRRAVQRRPNRRRQLQHPLRNQPDSRLGLLVWPERSLERREFEYDHLGRHQGQVSRE